MKTLQKQILYTLSFLFCMLILHTAKADKTKQALKYLERGEYDKVEEIIIKSIEKEAFNPNAKYIFAILYSTIDYHNYNIDSARVYITIALEEHKSLDSKKVEESEKAGVFFKDLEERKRVIQLFAFQKTVEVNTIREYNVFLEQNTDAIQVVSIIKKRDSLAFLQTEKNNSWKSYKSYMSNYPNSENYELAKSRYDNLIFQSKTSSGELFDLQKFVEEHPNSPFRTRIEGEIFSIITASSNAELIFDFIDQYQNLSLTRKAINILYHLDENARKQVVEKKGRQYQAVLDSISKATTLDNEVLFPILEDSKYLFINFSGEQVIKGNFDEIASENYCGNITSNILDVTEKGRHKLINRIGTLIYESKFIDAKDLGNGVLKVASNGKYKVIHKSGFVIAETTYDDVSMVGNRLIKVNQNELVGLIGINGRVICPIIYNDIYTIEDYWIFEKNEKIGILSFEEVIKGANGKKLDPILKYEEAELIDDQYLICFTEDKEVLFNRDLRKVVPEAEQRINTRYDTWTAKQPFGYRVFNKELGELTHTIYDNLLQNNEWLALKKNKKWSVYKKGLSDTPIIGLDSVKLIGNDIAMVFRKESGTAIFPNKKTVEFTTQDQLYSINNSGSSKAHYLVINKKGINSLYRDGELLFSADYDKIGFISDSAFYVKANGKYGAVGVDGKLIMRVRYNAIIEAQNEIAPVLYRGKFGAYNFRDRILLKLDYDQKLRAYNDQLMICKLAGKDGLIGIDNTDVLEAQYDEVKYWTDSIALTKTGNSWAFTEVYSGETVYGNILDYKVLLDTEQITTLRIRTAKGYGIYSTINGLTIVPTFSDIVNINTLEEPLYFCEKSIPEGNYYIAIYKNKEGKTIRSQAYRSEEYERIVCE